VTHYTKNSARIINQKLLHTRICSTANYNLGSSGSICKLGKSASLLKMAHWIELRDYSLSLSKTKEIYSFGLKRLSHDVDKSHGSCNSFSKTSRAISNQWIAFAMIEDKRKAP
jgi:hypothetical protein